MPSVRRHRPSKSQGAWVSQLDALAQAMGEVAERFAALDARLRDEQWQVRPAPREWSVAECVAHLNLTSAAMLPRLRTAVEQARALGPVGTRAYKESLFGRVLARLVGPVPTVLGVRLGRTKTAAAFVPGADLPRAAVVEEYHRAAAAQKALLWSVEDLQIDRVTVESPFVAGARYDAYSALWILVRHELRHLVQADRALDRLK